ncbi:MAG: phytanoyl-CoA dioxygenase family protein [Aestuariibacter sp.]
MNIDLTTEFKSKGYCLIENGLSVELLKRWQTLAEKLEKDAVEKYQQGSQLHGVTIVQDKCGPRLMRYNDIFSADSQLVLDTLACPAMLILSKELCGIGSVPLQMDIVFKQQHPHPVVNWHQDAQHSRKYPYLNVGIYLDDAASGDGCLRYVPGTQYELQDIRGLSENYGWEVPGVVEQPAKAGDILVQDIMILHGSQPKRSEGVRRTIYVELRPWQGILESQKQSEQWSNLRRQWMSLVLLHDSESIWPEEWKNEYPEPAEREALFRTILENREAPEPSVWATFPVDRKDYPIPEDMLHW